jgi:hypothetical protein
VAGRAVSFCLAVEIVKAFVPRDVARGIFLRVLYLIEFPRHLFVFAKAVVVPGLLCLGAALLGVIESVLCALGLRVPQVCLPGKKGTLVCAFARHTSLLPPPRVAGLALMYARCRRTGAGDVNYAVLARPSPYFLKASFTFSPASLRLDFALIALALILGALVAGDLADRFLGLAAKVLASIFRVIVVVSARDARKCLSAGETWACQRSRSHKLRGTP